MKSREMRERVSRQFNWIEILTRMLRIVKNTSFYRLLGRNRPIETIDYYDETSTMDLFGKYRGRRIEDEASGCDPRICVIKCLESRPLDLHPTSRCFPRDLIWTVITPPIKHVRRD